MRAGMIYTSFAVMASSLLLLMVAAPVDQGVSIDPGEAARISEASFFLESILKDMDRSLKIATRRALTGATNYVIETGDSLSSPRDNLTSALVNGTISGRELNATGNASLDHWTVEVSEIAGRSGYSLDVQLEGYSFNASGTDVEPSYTVFVRLKDPSTLAAFNRTRTEETSVSVSGLDDPMILLRSKGRYVSQYESCPHSRPAEKLYEASYHSPDPVHGKAEKKPFDISAVSNEGEKVLVVEDVDSYSQAEVNDFAGAVSAEPNSSSGYTTEYAFDTGSITDVDQNMSLILNSGEVWRSSFREMFQQNCYVETPRGPDVLDRLGNRLVSDSGSNGTATLLEVTELPPELRETGSAVGYVYFNSTGYGGLNEIRGVTSEYSWFRLDDHHVDLWNLESLAH